MVLVKRRTQQIENKKLVCVLQKNVNAIKINKISKILITNNNLENCINYDLNKSYP